MKKIATSLLLLIPLIGMAEDKNKNTKQPLSKVEISFSSGTARDGTFEPVYSELYIGNRNNLSVLRNFNRTQIGVGTDVNLSYGDFWDFVPHAFVNRTINLGKMYLYGGVMGGYISRQIDFYEHSHKGFVLGLQSGIVCNIGKHFAFSAEIGMRRQQLVDKRSYYKLLQFNTDSVVGEPQKYVDHIFPTSFGLRYRL